MSDIPTEKLFCYRHPNRETSLRCNRCERPICPECAVLTPTGYRCVECVRDQQKVFDTAKIYDYPIAFILAAGIAFAGSLLASRFGFFSIFIGPLAGLVIAEVVRFAVHRRRSRLLYQITALATLLGSLPLVLIAVFASIATGSGFALISLIWPVAYGFLATSSVYYRLSGIQVRF